MTTPASATPVTLGASASIPLLQTKLNVPRSGARLVARARLTERLNGGAATGLTLVSAPAGFGKTTLLAQWLAAGTGAASAGATSDGAAIAWVSLEPSENDATLFWSYVASALRRADPAIGGAALALLESGGGPIDSIPTLLVNDLAGAGREFTLVLDDYHVIQAEPIHDGVAFLVEHAPAGVRVVIASRSDPPLPIARLRARGELTELRASDLRFALDEASAFLREVMALELAPSDVAELDERTEGWITALKLAALARGTRGGASDGRAFRGDRGYVADYVIDEILGAESEPVRHFLLATSVLARLSGPLCDAVAERADSSRLLDSLARRNLFVVALDDDGTWYRYHHLFADVLRAHANRSDPGLLAASHLRASRWHESNGTMEDAVTHALEAGDAERAAELLGRKWPEKNRSHETGRWLRLARALPESVFVERPALCMGYAWALLNAGDVDAAEAPLRRVEQWLAASAGEPQHADRQRALAVELAAARGYVAQMQGNASGTLAHARRSLELIPESDDAARATGTALVALALWSDGQLDEAHDTFAAALTHMRRAGRHYDAIRGTFVLGDLRAAQGRLHDAVAVYEGGLRVAAEYDEPGAADADELYLGLAEVSCERNDLEGAERYLGRLSDAWTRARHAGNRQRWCTAMARIRAARGDHAGALALIDEADAVQVPGPLPQPRPIRALRARAQIAAGRLAQAIAWVESARISANEAPSYAREFELLTLARVLLAHARGANGKANGPADAARGELIALLGRVGDAAARAGRKGALLEAHALHALALLTGGNVRAAVERIGRALELAEPEGFVRVFADEGEPMRDLLRHAIARGVAPTHAQRVLAALEVAGVTGPGTAAGAAGAAAGAPGGATSPGNTLTERELVILRLLATGLRNQEIAEHLFISPATVKRHVANIYLKLDVGHRTAALARATELGIL